MASQGAAPAGSVEQSPAPDRPDASSGPRIRLRNLLLTALGLFALGFAASYILFGEVFPPEISVTENAAENPHLSQAAKSTKSLQTSVASEVADLKRADALLHERRWNLALAAYQAIDAKSSELVQYKIALCLEGLGRWDKAAAAYRAVLGQGKSVLAQAALVGQARVLLRLGEAAEAANLLFPFLLQNDQPGRVPEELAAEARYLLALSASFQALPRGPNGPLDPGVVRSPLGSWNVRPLLDDNPPRADKRKRDALAAPVPKEKEAAPPEPMLSKASLERTAVKEALDTLAARCGLQTHWTPTAVKQVEGRSTSMAVGDWPLLDVAAAIAAPLKILCQVQEKTLLWWCEEETDAKTLAAYRVKLADRVLRQAIRKYPGHVWTAAALVELGNLEESQGRLSQALTWYERVVQDWPRSPWLIPASYNLGVLYERQGQTAGAEKAFYGVVDHGPGHPLTPRALLHIGWMHLNRGEWTQAQVPLRRGVAAAAGSDTLRAVVVTLAAAYLAAGNSEAANALLFANREAIAMPPYRKTAAFLDAYALYRTARARKQTRREPAALLAALLPARKESVLGIFGTYLVGKAFRDLNMWDEVVTTYAKGAKPAANPLLREMTFYLAEAQFMLKKLDRAVPLLAALADNTKDNWSAAAHFQLAAIALQQDRPGDCLRSCKQIWQQQLPVDRPALLHLMGEAYDRTGDHLNAARCFAGQPPE
jgi:tetratricopeptide (TPR) repeat protein